MDTSLNMSLSPIIKSRPPYSYRVLPAKRVQQHAKTVSFGVVDVLYYRADLPTMQMMQEVIRVGNSRRTSQKIADATKLDDVARKKFAKERIDGLQQRASTGGHGKHWAQLSPQSDHSPVDHSSRFESLYDGSPMSSPRSNTVLKNYHACFSPPSKSTASSDHAMMGLHSPQSSAHLSDASSTSPSPINGVFHMPHHAPSHAQPLSSPRSHAGYATRQPQPDVRQTQLGARQPQQDVRYAQFDARTPHQDVRYARLDPRQPHQDIRQAQLDAREAQQLRLLQQRGFQPPQSFTKPKPVRVDRVGAEISIPSLTRAQQHYLRSIVH